MDNNLTKEGMGKVSASRMHDDSVKELEQVLGALVVGVIGWVARQLIAWGVEKVGLRINIKRFGPMLAHSACERGGVWPATY